MAVGFVFNFGLGTAPPTPASGYVGLYFDTADKRVKTIDETPTTRVLVDRDSVEILTNKKIDDTCTLIDNADNTKILTPSLGGMTTGINLTLAVVQTTSQTLTLPNIRQGETLAAKPQIAQSSPSDPTGTTSLTGVMMGLAGAITPQVTGRIFFIVSGTIANATGIADGANVQLRYGTGAAPTNAAALTGTTLGGLQKYITATTAEKAPFSVQGIASGLTLGTAYWLDVGLAAVAAGTATIKDLSVTAFEL